MRVEVRHRIDGLENYPDWWDGHTFVRHRIDGLEKTLPKMQLPRQARYLVFPFWLL